MASPTRAERTIFLGYLARKPWKPEPSWDPEGKTGVIEACSVSDCMCERTPDWVEAWDYNRATCYETIKAARDAIPLEESDSYAIFAYWLVAFAGSLVLNPVDLPFDGRLPPLPVGRGPEDFEQIGFDVVGLGPSSPFECSPLSCNHAAREVTVNRWCLIDELERARDLEVRWSAANGVGVEPGTYCVVRVARERSAEAARRGSKG